MKRALFLVLPSLVIPPLCAFLFWCGGFNFDSRNVDVAFGVLFSLALTAFTTFILSQTTKP